LNTRLIPRLMAVGLFLEKESIAFGLIGEGLGVLQQGRVGISLGLAMGPSPILSSISTQCNEIWSLGSKPTCL